MQNSAVQYQCTYHIDLVGVNVILFWYEKCDLDKMTCILRFKCPEVIKFQQPNFGLRLIALFGLRFLVLERTTMILVICLFWQLLQRVVLSLTEDVRISLTRNQ